MSCAPAASKSEREEAAPETSTVDTTEDSDTHTQDTKGSTPSQTAEEEVARVIPLSDLHLQLQSTWTINARVLAKSALRLWNTWSGAGQLFEVYLIDAQGRTMKATVFNDGTEKYDSILSPGATCALSKGRIKYANAAFSSDLYELTFDDNSSIYHIPAESVHESEIALTFTPLSDPHNVSPKSKINVFAIFEDWAASKRVKTAQGKDLTKRDILLVDKTLCKAVTTMWGHRATEDVASFRGRPILIKAAQVTVFNGNTTLYVGTGASTIFDPICSQATRLLHWYAELPEDQHFE